MDYNSHMPRAKRYFVPGYACHLTHRCHNREFLPRFATDRDHYRMLLREGMLELGIALLDFCITSNHVHVLALADEDERISAFMQKIQGQFGQAYNRRNKRSGIEERTARDRIQREPQWTECVAVGSEGFARSIESRIQGRQQMEVVAYGDRWLLREAGAEYDARRRSTEG